MNIQAWPFLVSRNRYLGYQTVVAPSFMVEANITGLLANHVGGEPSDYSQYMELPKNKVGDLFAVYRVVRAIDENTVLRDESGRPILWIEGVVLREPARDIAFSDDVLQEAHRRVEPDYRQFWAQAYEGPVRRSHPFSIDIDRNRSATVAATEARSQFAQPDQLSMPVGSAEAAVRPEPAAERSPSRVWSRYVVIGLAALLIASLLGGGIMFFQNRLLTSQVRDLEATIQAMQTAPAAPTPQK